MKRWERAVLLAVAAVVAIDLLLRIGGLLVGGLAMAWLSRPFRVHGDDVMQGIYAAPQEILCPVCHGAQFSERRDPETHWRLRCQRCNNGRVEVASMERPVVVVADNEPTDYPAWE